MTLSSKDTQQDCLVGGVRNRHPYKIRRLGHVGLNVNDVHACLPFYRDLLGFVISDIIDLTPRFKSDEDRRAAGNPLGYFMRHGTEHHSFALFPKTALNILAGRPPLTENFSLNQVAWQVGSLKEVTEGIAWLQERAIPILRTGRDLPGSNWHVYIFDPERHVHEFYYGMEQIGWQGASKPEGIYTRKLEPAILPQQSEYAELRAAEARGVDLSKGYAFERHLPEAHDVGGVSLEQPFKINRVGPVRLFVRDMDAAVAFYRDVAGLIVTEETSWNGHRCVFFRCNTDHHALALYPMALRDELGFSSHTTCMSFGLQLGDYDQLRAAIAFFIRHGYRIVYLPPELYAGIDYSAFVIDPEGQAVQLYCHMEQIGWDGKPRPAHLRPVVKGADWPAVIEDGADYYTGEVFLGPFA